VNWLELSVQTDHEAAEAVVELFNRYGRGGAVVEIPVDCYEHDLATAGLPSGVVVKTYLPQDGTCSELRTKLEEGLWHLAQIYPIPEPVFRDLAEEDWANAWKKQYHPLRVGRRILIVPVWEEHVPQPDDLIIWLEPGMAFGTGLHPTTRLCLQALETHLVPSATVLDVGTGSGILAVAAAKLGAASVLAVDADPVAVPVAQENTERNGVADRVTVRHASLPGGTFRTWLPTSTENEDGIPLLTSGLYDLVVINILAPVITGMAPALGARTAPTGRLIAAGLIEDQEAGLRAALQAEHFRFVDRLQEKDWVALVAERE